MATITSLLVGAHFRPPAKLILEHLPSEAILILEPEPDNAYDPNAIQVLVMGTSFPNECHEFLENDLSGYGFALVDILDSDEPWHLGFIAKDFAAEQKSRGFPEGVDVPGTFSVNAQGKARVRFEENW